MQSKRDISIMETEKRKNKGESNTMHENIETVRERERERELIFKPTTKKNLVLFTVPKLYIKYQNKKDGLCLKRHDSS